MLPENEWPSIPFETNQVVDVVSSSIINSDIKPKVDTAKINPSEKFITLINYYSDFQHLIRLCCYTFRVIKACFIKNLKKRKAFLNLCTSPLTVQERSDAENYIVKIVQ